ncbi:MAG: tRNA 2-thiouridine(34) synthase MnmA [Acidimicrobiia bacterium]|nr:MAG: tRNA 2-thiouridine(34) synthase MnmA [Acidimicrobiia bacterium]
MRALVAMSGGVDSSVAAALTLAEGHEVVGVTLKQWVGEDGRLPATGCCTVADAEDARSVAARLGIRHYVLDHVADFTREVVDRFVAGYRAGLTPNPCIECNRRVRFGALFDRLEALGCDFLVTGHHARVVRRDGSARLLVGRDGDKDQSYVLHMLSSDRLERVRLPIGELTKAEVREHASRLGLRTAAKPDSQDLCFVDGDYRQFLARRAGVGQAGEVVDRGGNVLAVHDGVGRFTVGQRRGLGISGGEQRFVLETDSATGRVVVGSRHDLASRGCIVSEVGFIGAAEPPGTEVAVKVRYRTPPVPARIFPEGDEWRVEFQRPQEAVAPGQAAVFYRGDEVLGGGTILTTVAA